MKNIPNSEIQISIRFIFLLLREKMHKDENLLSIHIGISQCRIENTETVAELKAMEGRELRTNSWAWKEPWNKDTYGNIYILLKLLMPFKGSLSICKIQLAQVVHHSI